MHVFDTKQIRCVCGTTKTILEDVGRVHTFRAEEDRGLYCTHPNCEGYRRKVYKDPKESSYDNERHVRVASNWSKD